MTVLPCPICGRQPDVSRCEPWSKTDGPAPWYAGCYQASGPEHFVGGNGDTKADAERVWNDEAKKRNAN